MKQIVKQKEYLLLKLVAFVSFVFCTLFLWGMISHAATEKTIRTTADFTVSVAEEKANSCKVIFLPVQEMDMVDIHFKVNGGDQQNLKMIKEGESWNYTIGSVNKDDSIEMFFTYIAAGAGKDSEHITYVVGTAQAQANPGENPGEGEGESTENNVTSAPIRIEAENCILDSGITKEDRQISSVDTNDWMRYETGVEEAGTYRIVVSGKAVGDADGVLVFRDAKKMIASVEISEGEAEFTSYKSEKVELAAGSLELTVIAVSGEVSVDWFELEPVTQEESGDGETPGDTEEPGDNESPGDTGSPEDVVVPEFDTTIPQQEKKIIFQINNRTNGAYSDDEIYWSVLGYHPVTGKLCYVDAQGNLHEAHTGLNTDRVGDRMCAKIYNKLSENKYMHMPSIRSGRMYISYGEPVHITINVAADGLVGFAGPDMNNPSDPNREVYFEFMEFTIGSGFGTANENPIEYWGNTTRVDNFCFPVVTRLIGENGQTNGIHYDAYDKTVGDIGTREQIYQEFVENAPEEFKNLAEDYRIIAPCKGSFNEGKANANYFQDYINQFWKKFAKEDLKFECQGGDFVARVNGDYIEFTEKRSGQTGRVRKPNTQEVLEGKGAFDSGSAIEKVFEAQLCAAFNRGVALNPKDWYTPEKYYQTLPYNYYSKFWHEHGVEGYAYGFCYDDVHEQATLLHFTNPKALVIDLKW